MVEMECCRVTRILLVFWIYTFTNVYGENLCDDGWNDFGGNCYLVREEYFSQADAKEYCEVYGSNLASIHSHEEQDFIHSILKIGVEQHQAWIGLTCDSNCMTEQSNWRWMDGSPMDYKEPWGMGEPDSYDPCARLRSDNKWANIACSSVYYSVCEKPGKETKESGGGSTTVATPPPSIILTTIMIRTPTTTVPPSNMQSDAASSSSTTKNTTINSITTSPQNSSALSTTARTTEVSSGTEKDTSTAVYHANSANPDSTPIYIAAALGGALFVVIIVAVLASLLYCSRKKKAMANSDLSTQSMHSSSNGGHTGGYSGLAAAPPSQVDGSVYSYLDDAVTDDAKATQVDGDPQYSAAIPRPTEGSLYGGSIAPYSSTRVAQREVRPAPPGLRNSGGSLNSVPSRPVNSSGAPTTGGIPVYAVPMKKPKVTDDDAGSSIVDNDVYNQL